MLYRREEAEKYAGTEPDRQNAYEVQKRTKASCGRHGRAQNAGQENNRRKGAAMAKLNLDYYKGEDLYSDGDIEEEILEIVRSGRSFEELGEVKFPVIYHLSKVRENILNWYPFSREETALEIGSGCGAITGLLCTKLGRVVSAELSKRRATINYERHAGFENLEICVGNLNDMEFEEKFDYVIFNGVFEYALSFTEGEKPYETYLRNVSRFLKSGGRILVAIENRLGLKYFAGAPEDHTDGYFDGLREYEGNDSVRTFSKAEWESLMRRCGFPFYKFYYPYPDYKFPREIFTDESLAEQKYGCPTWNFTKYRMAMFSEEKMAAALQQEGVMAQFANSFLIEMSDRPFSSSVQYAKLSTDRAPRFSIATVIHGNEAGRCAVKLAAAPEARSHIDRLLSHTQRFENWQPLVAKRQGDGIVYPFLETKSLGYEAEQAVKEGNTARLRELFAIVQRLCSDCALRHISASQMTQQEKDDFRTVFGGGITEDALCVAPANIDLILDNIFRSEDGRYQVIDCEWMFDFPVPVSFLLWRSINELYSTYPFLEQQYPKLRLLEEFSVTEQQDRQYWQWATYFAEQYVGANRLLKRSTPEIGVSLEEFRIRLREQEILPCHLFVDTGNGFSEQEKLAAAAEIQNGRFAVTFDLSEFKTIRKLRFDPVEGRACVCKIDPAVTTCVMTPENAACCDERGDIFLTPDPIYQIADRKDGGLLSIGGQVKILTMEEILQYTEEIRQKMQEQSGGFRKRFWKKK